MQRKLGKSLKPLLIVLLISLIGLSFLEVTISLLFPGAASWHLKIRFVTEKNNLHALRPDALFHHVGDNKYHLDFPPASDSRLPRIMIVGDSFAMAEGVVKGERFGSLLQTNLGNQVSVDVLAASSYSPVVYRNIIRTALTTNSYRAVIVFVDQTDPADDLIYQDDLLSEDSWLFNLDQMTNRAMVLDNAYGRLLEQFSGWVNPRYSAIYNVLKPISVTDAFSPGDRHYHYVTLAAARTRLVQTFAQEPAAAESRQMEALLTTHLDQILSMCREHKIPLFLAANPWEAMCSSDPNKGVRFRGPFPIQNRLEHLLNDRYAGTNNIYIVPLTQAFRAEKNPSNLFLNFVTEIHWNKEGHIIVERALRKELLAKLPDLSNVPFRASPQ
jgi:hypothetical protein